MLDGFTAAADGRLAGMDVVGDWSPVHVQGWFRKMFHLTEHPPLDIDPDYANHVNQCVNLRLLAERAGAPAAASRPPFCGRRESHRRPEVISCEEPPAWTAATLLRDVGRRLSLVLPAYNEEAGIRQAVVEADDALAVLFDDYEILVVDDGSRDATAAVVREEAAARPHVRLVRHEKNKGYGAACARASRPRDLSSWRLPTRTVSFILRIWPAFAVDRSLSHRGRLARRTKRFLAALLPSRGYNMLTRALLGSCVRDCDCASESFPP